MTDSIPVSASNTSDPNAGTIAMTRIIDGYISLFQQNPAPLSNILTYASQKDDIHSNIEYNPNGGVASKAPCEGGLAVQGLTFWRTLVVQNKPKVAMHWIVLDEGTQESCTFYTMLKRV